MCVDEIKIIRQWFKDYQVWKAKAARKKPRLHGIHIDGLPKGKRISPDDAIIEYTNATNECQQRLDVLKVMADTGENGPLYADIIEKRYLRNWTTTKTLLYIGDHYDLYVGERSFRRYEREGLQLALDLVQ